MTPLSSNAARQYIDSVSVFEAHEEALREVKQVRGGMYWHKGPPSSPEDTYLVRTTPSGGEKSVGLRSIETERIHDRFHERKQLGKARLAGLTQALDEHRRLNRALRVGRVDPLVVEILNRLAASGLSEHFRVVGTHALYAYEAAAGIRFESAAVATRDIDLMWDVRKRVQFDAQIAYLDTSMLGILRKADPTFKLRDFDRYTAVNKDGFEVDIIRREAVEGDPHPVRLSPDEDDFIVAQAPRAQVLIDSPPFSAIVIATDGRMARMNTLHPLSFSKFKQWMASLKSREPTKRGRDALQARLVAEMVAEYLPHLAKDAIPPPVEIEASEATRPSAAAPRKRRTPARRS